MSMMMLLLSTVYSFYEAPEPINTHVNETTLVDIKDLKSLESFSKYENVRLINDSFVLRDSNGNGSQISFKEMDNLPNWSFEFTVKNLILKDIENAGFYLWLTKDKLEKGGYNGGSYKFDGFVIGVDFNKERAAIAFSYNYGLDYEKIGHSAMKFDCINPILIENLEYFKFKVIHTDKNFKLEIYDDKNHLLSDHFRMLDPSLGSPDLKKHFAITTTYSNVPLDIHFDLKEIKLNSRVETEDYDQRNVHTDHNIFPRSKEEEELRTALASVDFFSNYLSHTLGTESKNLIIEMLLNSKKKTKATKILLEKSLSSVNDLNSSSSVINDEILYKKMLKLEKSLDDVSYQIDIFNYKLKRMITKKPSKLSFNFFLIIIAIVLVIMRSTDIIKRRYYMLSKINKQ